MDHWVENLSVRLAEMTTRRDLLARLGRGVIGFGAAIAAMANGGVAFASHCYLFRGGCGGCSNDASGSGGCGGAPFCGSSQCAASKCLRSAGCKKRAAWYCCCTGTLWRCQDCICPGVGFCICPPTSAGPGSC